MISKSKKFGSFQDLSTETEKHLVKIIEYLDEKEFEYSIYYGYPVIDEKNNREFVKGIIISNKGIFVLYENPKEQDAYVSRIIQLLSQDMELFGAIRRIDNYLIECNIINFDLFKELYSNNKIIFDESLVEKSNRAIQTAYGISRSDDRNVTSKTTLGYKIKARNTFIGTFDEEQFNMIHSFDNENLRIRGLAGSGKTILLVKKMAYFHYKYPEKQIAFVFYTISLKQHIFDLFKKYYKDYDRYGEPNLNKISIYHSWGSSFRRGFYYDVCDRVGYSSKTFSDAKYQKGDTDDSFEYVCKDLLNYLNSSNTQTAFYDYIFVDEAQDFNLQFFNLIRRTLNSNGKLYYAYDELQSLNEENSMPSKSDIFGDDKCEDINLKISYRAPVEILTTAHALGMGIYRTVGEGELPFVNILRDTSVWHDIGYENLNGEISYGSSVNLIRKEERNQDSSIITTIPFDDEIIQYHELSKIIINMLQNEDVLAEDILIIDLSYKLADNHTKFRTIFNTHARTMELFDNDKKSLAVSINLVNKDNPTRLKVKNTIPYTTIFRAKGNEANLVFIVNADSLEMVKSISRNKIFTAMTRARYAVWLMGLNQIKAYSKEIEIVKENNYSLKFLYPTEIEMELIKTYGEKESVNERKMQKVVNDISSISKSDPDLARKLLMDMLKDLGDK